MTAIYGVIGQVAEDELKEMGRRLAHRGIYSHLERISDCLVLGTNDSRQASAFRNDRYAPMKNITLNRASNRR